MFYLTGVRLLLCFLKVHMHYKKFLLYQLLFLSVGKITYDLSLSKESKRISTQTLAPQKIFTNFELTMTVELEQNTPKEKRTKCAHYNYNLQTTEDKCLADENCEYSTVMGECTWRRTKKVNKTYKIPIKAPKTSNS